MTITRTLASLVTLALLLGQIVRASAQPAEPYAGKTITIIVGLDAGGTADTLVRSLTGYIRKHTPGNPTVIVQNMPGAAGALAINYLMEKAPRDGSTVVYQPWDPLGQALGNPSLRARYEQFEYIGGTSDIRVMYARRDAIPGGLNAPADIMKADGIAVGALNNTDLSGLIAKLALETLGVRHKFIAGYRGGNDIFLAMQRGEVQLHTTSIGTLRTRSRQFIISGQGIEIAYHVTTDREGRFERNRYITDIPPFPELFRQIHGRPPSGPTYDALNWLVQQFGDVAYVGLAPPGTPAPALAALRAGLEAASNDPEFAEYATKTNGLPYTFVPVERGRAIFKSLAEVSPEVLATVRKLIGEGGK